MIINGNENDKTRKEQAEQAIKTILESLNDSCDMSVAMVNVITDHVRDANGKTVKGYFNATVEIYLK